VDEYFNLVIRHKPICEFAEVGVIRRAVEGLLRRRRRERMAYGHNEWLPHVGDKMANARALQAMASMGLVGLPNTEYGEYVLNQLIAFPAGKNDDAVDMCALVARAIEKVRPARPSKPPKPKKQRDVWDKAFDALDYKYGSWRVL